MRIIKNATPALIRIATAVSGLVSVKLTHSLLTPENFSLFSLVLFALAVGSALAAPLNRYFWAHNSHEVYVLAIYWTWGINSAVIALALTTNVVATAVSTELVLMCLLGSAVYAFAKIFERFTYGQVLFDSNFSKALYVSMLMAVSELLVVSGLCALDMNSVPLRLILPAVAFFAVAMLVSAIRPYLLRVVVHGRPQTTERSLLRSELLSLRGVSSIALGVTMTLAVMIDRFVISYFSIGDSRFKADYLLVLSYAIALQTLMGASIDLARKHVYQDDKWAPGAKQFSQKAFLFFTLVGVATIVAFPLFQMLTVIPKTIDFGIWAALVARSIALLVATFSSLDFVQSGNLGKAFPPQIAMLILTFAFLWAMQIDSYKTIAPFGMLAVSCIFGILLFQRFILRIANANMNESLYIK